MLVSHPARSSYPWGDVGVVSVFVWDVEVGEDGTEFGDVCFESIRIAKNEEVDVLTISGGAVGLFFHREFVGAC